MPEGKKIVVVDNNDNNYDVKEGDWINVAHCILINVGFLEAIDGYLWYHKMMLLRLNGAARKTGQVAEILDAHVAQVIGHTALLF